VVTQQPPAPQQIAQQPPAPQQYSCPDRQGEPLYKTSGSKSVTSNKGGASNASGSTTSGSTNTTGSANWIPTPCEVVIMTGAINHCIAVAGRTNLLDVVLSDVMQFANIGSGAAGATAAIVGGVTKTPPLWIAGAAAAGTSVVSAVKTLFSGTPPVPTPSSMLTAASSYASLYQDMVAPVDNDSSYVFYAGLWNAAGSACPPNLLLGNFNMFPIALTDLGKQSLQRANPQSPTQ
jgi:hypothetical protein